MEIPIGSMWKVTRKLHGEVELEHLFLVIIGKLNPFGTTDRYMYYYFAHHEVVEGCGVWKHYVGKTTDSDCRWFNGGGAELVVA